MRRSVLIASAAVAVLSAGSLALRACDRTEAVPVPDPVTTAPLPVDTAAAADGAGATVNDQGDGAFAAAVAAIRSSGRIATAGFITRADLITSLATEQFAPTLVATSAAQLAEMTAELRAAGVLAGELLWEEYPLTARVVAVDDREAVVEVWAVLVVGAQGVGAPRQVWRTVTMSLVWERDAWRIDAWDARPGPTPALAASSAVSDVTQVAEATSWAATVGGGG